MRRDPDTIYTGNTQCGLLLLITAMRAVLSKMKRD